MSDIYKKFAEGTVTGRLRTSQPEIQEPREFRLKRAEAMMKALAMAYGKQSR